MNLELEKRGTKPKLALNPIHPKHESKGGKKAYLQAPDHAESP
jgi:hypothetical protein